jgi:hypothetical protein
MTFDTGTDQSDIDDTLPGSAHQEPEPPTDDENDVPGDEAASDRGGRARGVNARLIARRSVEKYQRLVEVPRSDLAAAAMVVGSGVKAEPADLAVFVVTTARADLRLLDRVDLIATAPDAFEAMSIVMALDNAEARRVWDLLRELGIVSDRAAAKNSETAKSIARAALEKAPQVLEATERVRSILRK